MTIEKRATCPDISGKDILEAHRQQALAEIAAGVGEIATKPVEMEEVHGLTEKYVKQLPIRDRRPFLAG